ncbi:MAG TPA: sulfite exporter TauE/SafE family protein [Cyclobacteriaceae bacterium]|nr:sulfite exporter TauE/SafE family protein [Cyclobacteriaceae bacterium]
MISLFSYNFSVASLVLFFVVALCIGMSKTGVHGAGMISVPLLAGIFGGQLSSGIMLPMLCLADVMGVWYYHRHASWPHLKKLILWAVIGIVLGTIVGGMIDDRVFKLIMIGIILVSIVIMIWMEQGHKEDIPDYFWFAALCGIGAGFTSMIGNLAGTFAAVYLLSMRLPKNSFIGTSAWFFMVINWMKIPFHVWWWKTITWDTFFLDLCTLPVIALGAWLGILIVERLSEGAYRWFIIGMTVVAAAFMMLT